ncbi:MAG: bacteriorhodopsin [Bacteroidota bacterium]
METQNDVLRNPDSFMQVGDLVASTFLLSTVALFGVAVFILVQFRLVPARWKLPVLISAFVPLAAGAFSLFRTNYWITTLTNPVEFRFFDWFFTVPLMAIVFYYLLKPIGGRRWMFFALAASALWMLGFGYLGESLQPERSSLWGSLGSIGFAAIVGVIYGAGYPKIFQPNVASAHRKGYLLLSIILPLGWCVYPIGYMTVPGNVWEGVLSVNTVAIMYNLADIFNKGGLALVVAYIASRSNYDANPANFGPADKQADKQEVRELPPVQPPKTRDEPLNGFHQPIPDTSN